MGTRAGATQANLRTAFVVARSGAGQVRAAAGAIAAAARWGNGELGQAALKRAWGAAWTFRIRQAGSQFLLRAGRRNEKRHHGRKRKQQPLVSSSYEPYHRMARTTYSVLVRTTYYIARRTMARASCARNGDQAPFRLSPSPHVRRTTYDGITAAREIPSSVCHALASSRLRVAIFRAWSVVIVPPHPNGHRHRWAAPGRHQAKSGSCTRQLAVSIAARGPWEQNRRRKQEKGRAEVGGVPGRMRPKGTLGRAASTRRRTTYEDDGRRLSTPRRIACIVRRRCVVVVRRPSRGGGEAAWPCFIGPELIRTSAALRCRCSTQCPWTTSWHHRGKNTQTCTASYCSHGIQANPQRPRTTWRGDRERQTKHARCRTTEQPGWPSADIAHRETLEARHLVANRRRRIDHPRHRSPEDWVLQDRKRGQTPVAEGVRSGVQRLLARRKCSRHENG